jgi:SAM-dependent methyltransferase
MSATNTEKIIRCLSCDDSMRPLSASRDDGFYFCCRCYLLRVWPLPSDDELQSYYAGAYEVDRENYMLGVERNGEELLGLLGKHSKKGHLLEIGCSWGGFLALAESRGWKVSGVELAPESGRWAREHLSLEVHSGTLGSSPFVGTERFDVVAAWHVIEHLRDPLAFLREVYSCLKPNGILALRTPNLASLVARLNGRRWEWFGAPAHLTLFSPHGLATLCARAGFSLEFARTRRGDARNPWIEIARGTLLRAGVGPRIKQFLGWESRTLASASQKHLCSGNGQRLRMLGRLDRAADRILFFLYPVEVLCDLIESGPEILHLARRSSRRL